MPQWIRLTDRDLRQALSWRQEQTASYDSFFFDSSAVFVYAARRQNLPEFLSNIVHEYGHALLADTPVGFLLQTLFEIQARVAQALYRDTIQPVLRQQMNDEASPGERAEQLAHLATSGPRQVSQRRAVRIEANTMFERSAAELRQVLNQPVPRALTRAFATVHGRSALLRKAASVPHEALATYYQCGGTEDAVRKRYAWVASQLPPELGLAAALPGVRDYVAACRAEFTETDQWGQAFASAQSVASSAGGLSAVLLAASAALHFPYAACRILDIPDEEFTGWLRTPRLGPDVRFRSIAAEPGLLAAALHDPESVRVLMSRLIEGYDVRPLNETAEQFFAWIKGFVFNSECCRPAQSLLADPASRFGFSGQTSDWMWRLLIPPTRTMPPLLLDDGTIYAQHESEARWLANDFQRAEVVRIVARILERLGEPAA